MRNFSITQLIGALIVIGFTSGVNAGLVTIDFESLEHVDGGQPSHGSSYSEDGYLLESGRGLGSHGTLRPEFTGSTSLHARGAGSFISLTAENGDAFDLESIVLARMNQLGAGTRLVSFEGTLSGGGTVNQSFVLDEPAWSFVRRTFEFTGFDEVVSVTWRQEGQFHQFDNIVVNSVPEPVSLGLLGLGMLAVGVRRRVG